MKPLKLFAAVAASMLAAASFAAEPANRAAERVRADVEFLASDLLEGRYTGTRGHEIAARYVASQYRAIGLQPGGENGSWFQQVPFRRASHLEPATASLAIGRDFVRLRSGADFAAKPSLGEQARSLNAPLVFVGTGVSDARLGIDDYAGVDARGKIAVVLEATPSGLASETAAHLAANKAQTAAAKGAIGLVEIAGTGPYGAYNAVAAYGRPVLDWVGEPGKPQSRSMQLRLHGAVSRDIGRRLLAAAGLSLDKAVEDVRRGGRARAADLPARLTVSDRSTWHDFKSPEVIGLLPGSDPLLRHEYVVLMGHLDHLGTKAVSNPDEDSVYNGAIDNAVGVATLLEAARSFARTGQPPRRSVLFIANTGEEEGLLGADYFAANPTVPRDRIVGAVDLDMPLPLYEFTDVVAFGGEHSTVAETIADAARAMNVTVAADPMPEEALFVRSDHYRFVTRGIPAILLMTGHSNGGAAKWKDFLRTIYHKPNDDLSLPILWNEAARYGELNYRIARALADADRRPLWYEGDYFGETFAAGQPKAPRQPSP